MLEVQRRWRRDRRADQAILACIAILFAIFIMFIALAMSFRLKKDGKWESVCLVLALIFLTTSLNFSMPVGGAIALQIFCIPAFIIGASLVIMPLFRSDRPKAILATALASAFVASGYLAVLGYDYLIPSEITYEIKTHTNSLLPYTIAVPYIADTDVPYRIGARTVNCDADFLRVNVSPVHGSNRALRMTASGNAALQIGAGKRGPCEMSLRFSHDDRVGRYWVWCYKDSAELNISIMISAHHSYKDTYVDWSSSRDRYPITDEYQYLEAGWNIIVMEKSTVVP